MLLTRRSYWDPSRKMSIVLPKVSVLPVLGVLFEVSVNHTSNWTSQGAEPSGKTVGKRRPTMISAPLSPAFATEPFETHPSWGATSLSTNTCNCGQLLSQTRDFENTRCSLLSPARPGSHASFTANISAVWFTAKCPTVRGMTNTRVSSFAP